MIEALPIVLPLLVAALARPLWRRGGLDANRVRLVALVAGGVLLLNAVTEPARFYPGLLFSLLAAVFVWRPRGLARHSA